ncbi:hypothetical protein SprV_0301018600 [Sparganum proliferum]
MGSPLSDFIAEVVLQKVETAVFEIYRPTFWARYVGDTFVIIKQEMFQEFHNALNSVSPDIQFTMEAESNKQLPFLDVLIHRKPALRSARRWETFVKRESSTYAQLKFLHRCLDYNVLPKCLRYRPPVYSDLCQRTMADFKKKMIRVLIRDCHARIHKYRQMIEQHSSTCQSIFTAHELGILKAAILDSARHHRKLRDDQLSGKFEKISPPMQPSTDGVLVHNLSSHRFTQQQLTILSYDAKFSTRDARPKDFVASFESALQKCEADEECKNAMRQQVSTLLLQHKR